MIKPIIKYMALGALLASAACTDEFSLRDQNTNYGESDELMFRCADMLEVYKGPDNYATRAGATKVKEEKQINTLHVFFFKNADTPEESVLLTPTSLNFYSYQKINFDTPGDQALIKIPTGDGTEGLFVEDYSKVRVVAIANIDATDDADYATDDANSFITPAQTSNVSGGRIRANGRNAAAGDPLLIDSYEKLKQWVYHPRIRMAEDGSYGDISQLPKAGMPMIGELIVDLTQKPDKDKPYIINMKALMAKVNVSVELKPDQFTSDLPTLTITEYGVMNMPIAVPFEEPKGGLRAGKSWTKTNPDDLDADGGYFETYDVTTQQMFHKGDAGDWEHTTCPPEAHEFTTTIEPITINKNSKAQTFSYYTYENVNMPNYSAERANKEPAFDKTPTDAGFVPNYPPGIGESDYQRWKPTMAYEHRASALILKGSYTTHQGLTYQAQFTVYLGLDADIDFQVKRNHQYDNNIIIKGLDYVRNSTDEVYTFDGRVNVKSDNPLYLAVVEERHIDAHATALPVDVWLLNYEDFTPEPENYYTEVTFTIPEDRTNPGGNPRDWIQMVLIPREEMQSQDGRFYAGTGAEKYFYTNLLDDIKGSTSTSGLVLKGGGQSDAYIGHKIKTIDGVEYGAQCGNEVTVRCTPDINNSRSRIYFYIDENVGAIGNGNDRSVDIDITYHAYTKNPDGSTTEEPIRKRTLTIEQRGLLRVSPTWTGNDGATANIPETYIEYYEEYLEHNDPLDRHEQPGELYEGLEWGLNGVNTGNGYNNPYETGNNYSQIYYKTGAFGMTRWVTNRNNDFKDVTLFNIDNPPASAFHYCYGKNKRNYDGSSAAIYTESTFLGFVTGYSATGWYMPGIRELEAALVQYYTTFDDFQGNLYWSASASTSTNYARATKVTIVGGKAQYANSRNNGDEGYVARIGRPLRIRAFYRKN